MLEKEKELEAKENTGQIPETERYSLRLKLILTILPTLLNHSKYVKNCQDCILVKG